MQATLYQSKVIVPIDTEGTLFCNWVTQAIKEEDLIRVDSTSQVQVNLEGVIIKKAPEDLTVATTKHYVYPSNEQVIWDINVAHLQKRKPNERLLLLVQASSQDSKGIL